jgi:hypothetical protein
MRILLILILFFSGVAQANDEIGVLKMFEQFTLSSAAAGKCIKPEQSELTAFLANYKITYIYALQEIKKRNPSLTKEQAAEIIKKGGEKATQAVYSVIEEEGCDAPSIQNLLKRFHVQAKWKP